MPGMVTTLGGIGLFLLGMMLLTDGIKTLAGSALREVLTRFVRGPITAMLSGTALTAVLQSSSATMLTTIGFVSAGLITFPQAIGVIFGANIGTTSTGWIVSMLGFKVSMGAVALPLVFLGALLRLLSRGKSAAAGLGIAGFGLIFFGIGLLQEGMGGLADHIDPASIPGDGLLGALLLVGVGLAMTVVMQSSSAAMAVTLAALYSGSIDVSQGAAIVIGQNIGTTVTTALAGIGASTAAKRTAMAHILFNTITGMVAFTLLPVLAWLEHGWESRTGATGGVGMLAAFHTGFNVVGVMLFLPATQRFARLVERLVPERQSEFARNLDASVALLGPVALESARRALVDVLRVQTQRTLAVIENRPLGRDATVRFDQSRQALPEIAEFITKVALESNALADIERQIGLMHAIDHLERMGEVVDRLDNIPSLVQRSEIVRARTLSGQLFSSVLDHLSDGMPDGPLPEMEKHAAGLAEVRRTARRELLERTARGSVSISDSGTLIDCLRWLDAAGYHTTRALGYLVPPSVKSQDPAIDSNSSHLA